MPEGQLQLTLMEGQMVVQLSQMHPRTDREQQLPDLIQPSQAGLALSLIPCGPDRGDPGLPDRIAMNEGGLPSVDPGCRFPKLLR